jgi:hypothetical protein
MSAHAPAFSTMVEKLGEITEREFRGSRIAADKSGLPARAAFSGAPSHFALGLLSDFVNP